MAVWSTGMRLRGSNGDWVEADPTHAGPGHRREPSRRAGGDIVTHRRRRQRGRGQRPGACARRRRARPRRRRTRGGRGSGATSPAAEYLHNLMAGSLVSSCRPLGSSSGPPVWARAAAWRVSSMEESAAAAGGCEGAAAAVRSRRRQSICKTASDKGVHARRRVGRWPLQGLAGRLHRDADGQYRGRRVLQVTSPQEMALPMH
ncbi:hypothetical protein GQ55_3G045900 [Panicum hallii var. hallii]|uniref:Uncharacterized protein n=1 Tax=Panicum hallii var. hallii TaxID=1504633 RepID=A0A2T7E5R0_9POAL|nr:hypothetical protein GQ55_3G045900 [Panicum hallii var. hallii]